jgi:hypothetical protein
VSCKEVGFLINHLQFYKCDSFTVFFHLWNNGGLDWRKELLEYEKDEEASWNTIPRKKISYAEAAKKPPISGANSIPILSKKEWRPRITVFDRLGKSAASSSQGSSKKFVFQLGFNNGNAKNGMSGTLIPRKSVFDLLEFDIGHAEREKNVINLGFEQIQSSDSYCSGFNRFDSEARNFWSFQSSNLKRVQVNNRYCIHCLRPGHWRISYRNPVVLGGGIFPKESIRISRGGSRERNKLGQNNLPPSFIPPTSHVSCNPLLLYTVTPRLLWRLN